MANQSSSATITSASGETGFVSCARGSGDIALTGTMSAGGIAVVVKPRESSTEIVAEIIDVTRLQEYANEAGTSYSFFGRYEIGPNAQIALKATAAFVGNIEAHVAADLY